MPNPTGLGFTFSVTATYGTTYNVNDSVAITVYNFPASQNVQFFLGGTLVGSLTTDSNGAGTLSTVVPPLPTGTYTPTAVVSSQHLVKAGATPYLISASFQAVDPTGAMLNVKSSTYGEYVPSNGMITVQAFGLNPTSNGYDFYDSIVAPSTASPPEGVYKSGLVTSISVGTGTSNLMQPAPNGTLIFTYSPGYAALTPPPATGTAGTITSANSIAPYGSGTASYQYYAIGAISFAPPTDLEVYAPGATGNSLSVSGLIPYTAALYPGVTSNYNAYMGSTELTLTFTNPSSTVVTGTVFNTGDTSISFTAPSTPGVYNLSITYNAMPVSSAVGAQPIVVSSPGSSGSAGTLVLVPITGGWDVVGFGYDPSLTSFTLYWMTDSGKASQTESVSSSGSFVDTTSLSTIATPPTTEAAGTYSVFTAGTLSGVTYYVYSSYTITASLKLSAPSGTIGTSVTPTTSGLVSTSYYNLYFGTTLMASGTPSQLKAAGFKVPLVPPGTYNVTITPVGSTSVVANTTFTVKAPTEFTLTPDPSAFPGQIVDFSWTPTPFPQTGAGYGPVYVTVFLNDSGFTTVQAVDTGTALTGSFQMPNAPVGTYWEITFGWSQAVYSSASIAYPFTDPTPSTQSITTGSAPVPLVPAGTSAATATFAFGSSGSTATDSLEFQINFAGDVFTSANNAVSGTAPITITGSGTSAFGNPVSYTVYVSAFTAGTAGTTPGSMTFDVTGTYNGQAFTSSTITITSGSTGYTASTDYYSTLGLPGTFALASSTTTQSSTATSTSATGAYLQLISGNGALITGISSGQIATITADVTNAVTTSMKVPLSELNASVVAINGAVAKINTAFGNMTATLSSINATVASISSGQVLVLTKLGSVETSLASLNASLTAFNGNIVTINTTLGQVKTTLAGINAQVTTNGNGIATISTDLGTLSGVVTATNGNVSTIKTNLGTLTTTVDKINTNTQGFSTLEIFLIVAIVLILITLVIAFLAVSNTNKLSKKFEEQKKQ